jgi:hypothetical protein
VYAVTNGHLDDIPVADCKRFEKEFLQYMETRHADVAKHISAEGTLPEKIEKKLQEAIGAFKKQFTPTEKAAGAGGVVGGGPIDQLKPDVGWDRVGERAPTEEQERTETEEEASPEPDEGVEGPVGTPPPGPPG